jgi:cation diffusion facilitator CzcD-associated flavoprotein CzcO
MPKQAVAVIGAGQAGLVTARYLKNHGFEPVIFDAASRVGGQWNVASPSSAIWPGMRTNTSRILTAFSDLDHEPATSVYPSQADMLAYLERYAETAALAPHLRLSTIVEAVEHAPEAGWLVRSRHGEDVSLEVYTRVVVATGYCRTPDLPAIAGLASFAGSGGAIHSSRYKGAETYRGRRVLVAGCSISALEIASELAAAGVTVTVAMRRQRYVLQKLLAGIPTDHVAFTRFAAQAGLTLPPEAIAAAMKQMVVASSGSPEQFGAPKPDENIFAAGLTQSQNYLALVAEGRIAPRPWIEAIDGSTVHFADGSSQDFDAIILGTGFKLALPFIEGPIAASLGLDADGMDLYDHTLHPDLDGLAFVGLYSLIGPYFPVLELQARWLAYLWAGLRPMPSVAIMQEGVAAARARRAGPRDIPMHAMAVLFADHAGVEPRPAAWPALERALWFGPLSPASFRLIGPDADPDAATRTLAAARAFNAITSDVLTGEEAARLKAVLPAVGSGP